MKKYAWILSPIILFSHPTNPTVISGEASITFPNSQTQWISTTDKAILHWEDFSINLGEQTEFILPDIQSSVLNRVMGENPTQILGNLFSNGQVLLINPHGVIFGENAIIDTGAFLASTFDILNADFLKGEELLFTGESLATISNEGLLRATNGDLSLIASQVLNNGQIEALQGSACIACAAKVHLNRNGEEKLEVLYAEKLEVSETGFQNLGSIRAAQVEIKADGNLYDFAIKQNGEIDALGFESIGGKICLVAEEGRLTQTGNLKAINSDFSGGKIHVLGKEIGILENAQLDISGSQGAGTLLIGGDFQGKNPDIPNAQLTFVEKAVKIKANATDQGDGGTVILWGDQATYYYGSTNATGGQKSGDGGFVEISGKYLDFGGFVDRRASNGKAGELLLDPNDFSVIAGAGTSAGVTFGGACGGSTYCATGGGISTIGNIDLTTNLGAGPVTITTSGGVFDKGEPGDITISAPVDGTVVPPYDSIFDLTFRPNRNLIVNDIVDNVAPGTSNIFVDAPNGDVLLGGPIGTPPSVTTDNTLSAGGNLTINCQNIGLKGGSVGAADSFLRAINPGGMVTVNASQDFVMQSGSVALALAFIVSSGDITLNVGGNVMTSGLSALNFISSLAGGLSVVSQGNISFDGTTLSTFTALNLFTLGDVSLANLGSISGSTNITAGGSFFQTATNIISAGAITVVIDENFSSAGQIGPSSVQIDASSLYLTSMEIRLFTGIRANNTILNTFNGSNFVAGPIFQNSATEQYGVYFSTFTGDALGVPFTIYYKESPAILIAAAQKGFVAGAEMFRDLHPFDEWILWYLRFGQTIPHFYPALLNHHLWLLAGW